MVKSVFMNLERPIARREFLIGGLVATAAAVGTLVYLRSEAGKGRKKEAVFAPGIYIDTPHHFLYSENWGEETVKKRWLIVTGSPEGPNRLSDAEETTLGELFEKASPDLAVGQVWTGFDLGPSLKNNRFYLREGLARAGGSKINLIVFSAGALSLFDLPEELREKVSAITFVSPEVGRDSAKGKLSQAMAQGLGAVSTEQYFDNVSSFIVDLRNRNLPVRVVLGQKDDIIDTQFVASQFKKRFGIEAEWVDRGHAPSPSEVIQLFMVQC